MKRPLIKFAVLSVSFGLIGCHTKIQPENTTTSAMPGTIVNEVSQNTIGVGPIQSSPSTIISGVIGNSMDSTDNAQVARVLDDSPSNQPYYWKNEKSKNKYKVVIISGRIAYKGYSDCRRYHSVAMIDGNKESMTAIACRLKNGTWKSV